MTHKSVRMNPPQLVACEPPPTYELRDTLGSPIQLATCLLGLVLVLVSVWSVCILLVARLLLNQRHQMNK